jgi:hypothetical protein
MMSWTDLSALVSQKRIVCFKGELQTGFKDAMRGHNEFMKERYFRGWEDEQNIR